MNLLWLNVSTELNKRLISLSIVFLAVVGAVILGMVSRLWVFNLLNWRVWVDGMLFFSIEGSSLSWVSSDISWNVSVGLWHQSVNLLWLLVGVELLLSIESGSLGAKVEVVVVGVSESSVSFWKKSVDFLWSLVGIELSKRLWLLGLLQ
jgi:hypothetical protein